MNNGKKQILHLLRYVYIGDIFLCACVYIVCRWSLVCFGTLAYTVALVAALIGKNPLPYLYRLFLHYPVPRVSFLSCHWSWGWNCWEVDGTDTKERIQNDDTILVVRKQKENVIVGIR